MNNWSEILKVDFPPCAMCGQCCRFASPSVPAAVLEERSKKNDVFALEFLSVFEPYPDLETVEKLNPEIIEKAKKIISKGNNKVSLENLSFYKCKFLGSDNSCLIHEDRPQLCRNFPDMPYLLFAPGCVYERWSVECKEKHKFLEQELDKAKAMRKELKNQVEQNKIIGDFYFLKTLPKELKFMGFKNPQRLICAPAKIFIAQAAANANL